MASPKEKFDAAVSVISSLPKNGPFQPSHEMMLSFYGYYKQATEGPCTMSKPSFWDVVRKAKWEAWHKLGNMPREEAMLNYVEELKKIVKLFSAKWAEMNKSSGKDGIVEAMPQTPTVGNFMGKIGAFYEMVDEPSPVEQAMTIVNGTSISQSGPAHNSSDLTTEEEANFSQQVELQLEKEMTTHVSIQRTAHTDAHKLTNGDTEETHSTEPSETITRSKDHVTSESESDEEFCDSSDQPTAELMERVARGQSRLQTYVSTPVKTLSGKPYHVHFSDNPHLEQPISNGPLSPIRTSSTDNMSFPRGFPFMQRGSDVPLSDSLLVNGDQTQHSLDTSVGSYLNSGQENMDLMHEELNFSSNNHSFLVSPSDRTRRGGEENSPPEGSSSQGQSSGARRGLRTGGAIPPGYQGSVEQQLVMGRGGSAGSGGNQNDPPQNSWGYQGSVNEQVILALLRLQQDMNRVLERLNQIEVRSRQVSSWWRWPFSNLSTRTIFIVLVWPIVVHFILNLHFHRKRR